nr:MAG TPA: hypothetical protein [Caudoviricetes sp.]
MVFASKIERVTRAKPSNSVTAMRKPMRMEAF